MTTEVSLIDQSFVDDFMEKVLELVDAHNQKLILGEDEIKERLLKMKKGEEIAIVNIQSIFTQEIWNVKMCENGHLKLGVSNHKPHYRNMEFRLSKRGLLYYNDEAFFSMR